MTQSHNKWRKFKLYSLFLAQTHKFYLNFGFVNPILVRLFHVRILHGFGGSKVNPLSKIFKKYATKLRSTPQLENRKKFPKESSKFFR